MTADSGAPEQPRISPVLRPADAPPPLAQQENLKLQQIARIRQNLKIPVTSNWELENEMRKERVQTVMQRMKEHADPESEIDVEKEYRELLGRKSGISLLGMEGIMGHTTTLLKMRASGIQHAERTLDILEKIQAYDLYGKEDRTKFFDLLKNGDNLKALARLGDLPETIRRLCLFGHQFSSLENLIDFAADDSKTGLIESFTKGNAEAFSSNCRLLRQKCEPLHDRILGNAFYGDGKYAAGFIAELGSDHIGAEATEALDLLRQGGSYARKVNVGFVPDSEEVGFGSFTKLAQQKHTLEERFKLIAATVESMGISDADPEKVTQKMGSDYEHVLYSVAVLNEEQRRRALDLFSQGITFSSFRTITDPEQFSRISEYADRMQDLETREAYQLLSDLCILKGQRPLQTEEIFSHLDMPHQLDAIDTVGKLSAESELQHTGELFAMDGRRSILDIDAVTRMINSLPQGNHSDFRTFWDTAYSRKYLNNANTLPSFLLGEMDFVEQHLADGHIDRQMWEKTIPDLRFNAKDRTKYEMPTDLVPHFDLLFDRELGLPEYADLANAYHRGLDNCRQYPVLQSGLRHSLFLRLDQINGFFVDGKPTKEMLFSFLGDDEAIVDRTLTGRQISDLVNSLPQPEKDIYGAYKAFFHIKNKTAPIVRSMLEDKEGTSEKRELFVKAAVQLNGLPIATAGEAGKSIFEELQPVIGREGKIDQADLDRAQKALHIIDLTSKTQSGELKRIVPSLKPLLMESADVDIAFGQIERMLLHNNLPQPLKNYLVMEVLFSQQKNGQSRMEETFTKDQGDVLLSPALKERSDQDRMALIYRRVMRNAIHSGDPNMRNYLETYREAIDILDLVDTHGIDITSHYHPQLLRFLDKAEALSGRMLPDIHLDEPVAMPEQTADRIRLRLNRLAQSMGVAAYKDIPVKLRETFLLPLGYDSFADALQDMDHYMAQAQERNRAFAASIRAGGQVFAESDLLKSTISDHMNGIMKQGPQCAELLGADSSSNNTPFDADFSRVGASDIGLPFNDVVARAITTSSTENNDIILLVKNRGNFVDTSSGAGGYKTDDERYETFWSQYGDKRYGAPGDKERRHYGVTVGVAATDVSAVILTDAFVNNTDYSQKLNKLKFDIVAGSSYVPVLHQGKLVFTPEEYDAARLSQQQIADAIAEANNEGKSGTVVLDVLMKNPLVAQMFGQPAHVQEGYTVGEHTRLVLGQFDKYVKDYLVLMNMNQGEFSLMLSLHDIGKSFTDDTRQQHQFTRPIIEDVVRGLDMPQMRKDLIVEIASQDILGEFIKEEIDQAKALQDIRYIAGKTGLTPLEIFQMCRYYYTCDVSSYTKDADPNGIGRFDDDIKFRQADQNVVLNPEWTEKLDGLKEEFLKQWLKERGDV